MCNELLSIKFLLDIRFDIDHLFYCWKCRLQALLHRRNGNLADTFGLQFLSFGKTAFERHETIETHFRSFLDEPFHSVEVLGWGNGKLDMVWPMILFCHVVDLDCTVFWMCVDDVCVIEVAIAIDNHQLITIFVSEYADSMARLFFVELMTCRDIG